MTKIYVLLPVHNRRETTRRFVECLQQQTFRNFHLVLIDDGSTDGTVDMVKEQIDNVTVLRGNGNLWWAGCLQRGLEWLESVCPEGRSLVLFINDDVEFAPNYLERAVHIMSEKKNTLLLSRFGSRDNDEVQETGVKADLRKLTFQAASRPEEINCLSTRGLFAYWDDVQRIGRFHPVLLPHYLSDYEYTIRASRMGIRCETSTALVIVPDRNLSGLREVDETSLRSCIRTIFSKRSARNPLYWSSFVLLTSDWTWIIPNLIRIWGSTLKSMVRSILYAEATNAQR